MSIRFSSLLQRAPSAHAKTIVHRDLKPENVMLVPDAETPGGERVKILDFGIAKLDASAQGSVRTRTYSMMGTPIYMAPEQCRGIKQIDDRADVYALGVMIYEMIAGQPPFLAEAPGDLIGMHMFKPPPTLRTAVPHVDGQLDSLVDSMLNKEPARRPSMSEVALLLKQLGNFVSNVLPMRVLSNPEISGRLRVPSLEQVRNASPTTEPANTAGTEQVSTSSRFRPLGDASRAQQGSTTADHGESERERALAPTMKAPVLRLDGADAAGRKPAHPVNVRISAKAAEHAKAATEPMDIVSLATPPAPRSEEPTAVMASSGIDAIAAAAIRAEYVEAPTAPVMNRANVQSAQDAYLRAKAASVAAASTEPATVPRMQGVTARHLASERGLFERAQVELGKRWANPEQRLGILVFGGLVVIGALLVLLVLVQGGQGN